MASRVKVSVSKSSLGVFEECARKWALHYRRYWLPPEIKREALYQYRLMGYNALAGQVVDDIVTEAIRRYLRVGQWPSDRIEQAARKLLGEYIEETSRWLSLYEARIAEPEEGYRQPVDRYFFGGLPEEAAREALVGQIVGLARAWFDSPVPGMLVELGTDAWLPPVRGELPPSFLAGDVQVWAKYDFAIRKDGETLLFDWKTGKVNEASEEGVVEQLHTYAAYAIRELEADPNRIKLYAVWLSMGPDNCLHSYPFDPGRIDLLEREWIAKHELLKTRLEEAGKDPVRMLELFPMTTQVAKCKYCKFRVCEGYARVEAGE